MPNLKAKGRPGAAFKYWVVTPGLVHVRTVDMLGFHGQVEQT